MSPTSMITERAEFRNDSGHVIGVSTKVGKHGEMKSIALQPDQTVWLDEEEQIVTANAPRNDEDNPFRNGHLTLVTEPQAIVNRRQIGYSDHRQVDDLAEEPGPAAGGSEGETPPGGSNEQGDDPPEPPKAPETPPKAPEGTTEGKVPPPNLSGRQTPEQEAQAKAAAARAIKTTTAPPGAAGTTETPAKAPEGKRAPTEEVGTPEAQGK